MRGAGLVKIVFGRILVPVLGGRVLRLDNGRVCGVEHRDIRGLTGLPRLDGHPHVLRKGEVIGAALELRRLGGEAVFRHLVGSELLRHVFQIRCRLQVHVGGVDGALEVEAVVGGLNDRVLVRMSRLARVSIDRSCLGQGELVDSAVWVARL